MPDDQDVLLSEIQRFRKGRDLWRAIALAALVLVFAGLIPFTIVFWRVVETRRSYLYGGREAGGTIPPATEQRT